MKLISALLLFTRTWGVFSLASRPIVELDYGTFEGNTTNGVTKFLGMPFAAPPIGDLRFSPPQPPVPFLGVRQATAFGPACFQQALSASKINPTVLKTLMPELESLVPSPDSISEDCLYINVLAPSDIPPGKKLPILVFVGQWIYGGGFETGDSSVDQGDSLVARSIALGEPVIYVSANYRLNAFGFLGGKEIKESGLGNVGLRDQRFALEWVQKYISTFGGDSKKVTIWGESAGAVSVGVHMVVNNGNSAGLFHRAVMESGSPYGLPDILASQSTFDQIVADTGCRGASNPIDCLRSVPFEKLGAAVNRTSDFFSFASLNLVWGPKVDGSFIQRNPPKSIQKGLYAKVPVMTGDCEDEGTIFSLSSLNITVTPNGSTNAEFLSYLRDNYNFPSNLLDAVSKAYPENVTQGSPFNTGLANAITPEFKRLAAIQGDFALQAPRRFFLQIVSKTQRAFAFLYSRGKAQPILGAFHTTDIPEFYGASKSPDFIATDALINFAYTGNPNFPQNPISLLSKIEWPAWTASGNPPLLTFVDPSPNVTITFDNYRQEAMELLTNISLEIS